MTGEWLQQDFFNQSFFKVVTTTVTGELFKGGPDKNKDGMQVQANKTQPIRAALHSSKPIPITFCHVKNSDGIHLVLLPCFDIPF